MQYKGVEVTPLSQSEDRYKASGLLPTDLADSTATVKVRAARHDATAVKLKTVRRHYCGMCEQLFARGGDCPLCGFKLEGFNVAVVEEVKREEQCGRGTAEAPERSAGTSER